MEVKNQLKLNYPRDRVNMIIRKLDKIVDDLNFFTYKKSIAIFASPVDEKIIYLDFEVNDHVGIDDSFGLRDLVNQKKESHQFLVLVLGSERTGVYIGNCSQFRRILANAADRASDYENDIAERVANFSDPTARSETVLIKFLKHTDDALSLLLESYPLPLFVMGTEKILGYFNKITKNQKSIIEYIHGSFSNKPESVIREAIKPHVADWELVRQHDLLNRLSAAEEAGKLVSGMRDVWKEACSRKGKLLVVDRDFQLIAKDETKVSRMFQPVFSEKTTYYLRDEVEDVIEKVLESGGEVEFIEDGLLSAYKHISLILYY
jgi:hypothetical protein